jgi:hypothetical protein
MACKKDFHNFNFLANILPEELIIKIMKNLFTNVLSDIKKRFATESIWYNPSKRLVDMCNDFGTIQIGYMDEFCLFREGNRGEYCDFKHCANCAYYGFPCSNFQHYSGMSPLLDCLWEYNDIHYGKFREKLIREEEFIPRFEELEI